ncbi:MAG TPA: polysaccharide deacetylase family protein [Bacillales bacterium]|nr:polysaccharide deacetylase family protein [Bacillales bacterium]
MKKVALIFLCILSPALLLGCNKTFQTAEASSDLAAAKYVPVLMYHAFTNEGPDSAHISPERFQEQLKYLKKKGYTTITLNQFLGFLRGTEKLPEEPLMITMDDSLLGQYKYAYPILKKLNMKAISFAIVSSIGKRRGSLPEYTWDEAREMENSGVFDIESHTYHSHRIQRGLPILAFPKVGETREEYTKRIRNDLSKSKKILGKKLDTEVTGLAYPFGEWNPIVQNIAKEVGFKALFSVQKGLNYRTTSPFFIKRIAVNGKWTADDLYKKVLSYEKITN